MSGAAREEQSEAREEQSESGQSLEVSQFFTRNKSFKIILGENEYYMPHALSSGPN